jgi:Holliday junction resolvase
MANKSKSKGTSFEVLVRDYLIRKGFFNAHRPALSGGKDTGDINGLINRQTKQKVAVQCKNQKAFQLSQWLNDTVEQAERLDGAVPVLVVKRAGKGEKALGKSYAILQLDDLVDLLNAAGFD